MKTYEERLPLIDEAIAKLKGLWGGDELEYLIDVSHSMMYVPKTLSSTYLICTRQEFEQRAKELGYINGYKYGVEYPVLCEKPDDLPDDVEVECFSKNSLKWYSAKRAASERDWSGTILFRIADERYKQKEQNMNDLPPVKSTHNDFKLVGLGYTNPQFEVTAHHYNGVTAIVSVKVGDGIRLHNAKAVHFQPIRTETDKLVEQLQEDILAHWYDDGIDCPVAEWELAKHLHEKGYRKIDPMSRDKYISKVYGLTDHVAMADAAKLYDAGCRFLNGDKDAS